MGRCCFILGLQFFLFACAGDSDSDQNAVQVELDTHVSSQLSESHNLTQYCHYLHIGAKSADSFPGQNSRKPDSCESSKLYGAGKLKAISLEENQIDVSVSVGEERYFDWMVIPKTAFEGARCPSDNLELRFVMESDCRGGEVEQLSLYWNDEAVLPPQCSGLGYELRLLARATGDVSSRENSFKFEIQEDQSLEAGPLMIGNHYKCEREEAHIQLLSHKSDYSPASGDSRLPSLSHYGRKITYSSQAGDIELKKSFELSSSVRQIFKHEWNNQGGVNELVSLDGGGDLNSKETDLFNFISGDGKYVLYGDWNLQGTPGDYGDDTIDLLRKDLTKNHEAPLIVGRDLDGKVADVSRFYYNPYDLSYDGSRIVYSALVDTSNYQLLTAEIDSSDNISTNLVSSQYNDTNTEVSGAQGFSAALSHSGGTLTFVSNADDFVDNDVVGSLYKNIFESDFTSSLNSRSRVSYHQTNDEKGNQESYEAALGGGEDAGDWVVFHSRANNLDDLSSTLNRTQIYLMSTRTAPTQLDHPLMVSTKGTTPAADPSGATIYHPCRGAEISNDGRYIVFACRTGSFDSEVGDSYYQIWIKYFYNDPTLIQSPDNPPVLLSTSSLGSGIEGNGDSVAPRISADGHFVVFESAATNLVESEGSHPDCSGSPCRQIYQVINPLFRSY